MELKKILTGIEGIKAKGDLSLDVKNITNDKEDLKKLSEFVKGLKTVRRFEVLPYHTLGVFKWKQLGIEYTLDDVKSPTDEEIKVANDLLHTADYDIITTA